MVVNNSLGYATIIITLKFYFCKLSGVLKHNNLYLCLIVKWAVVIL